MYSLDEERWRSVLKGKALAMDKLFMKSKLPGNRALADVQAMIEESVYSPSLQHVLSKLQFRSASQQLLS